MKRRDRRSVTHVHHSPLHTRPEDPLRGRRYRRCDTRIRAPIMGQYCLYKSLFSLIYFYFIIDIFGASLRLAILSMNDPS